MYYATNYDSPLGNILIVSDGESLCGCCFDGQKHFKSTVDEIIFRDDLKIFNKVISWLDDYFCGKNPEIDFKLGPKGSQFRQEVWKILSDIPYGETRTYGYIAREISQTMSAQAVGGAVGANPIAIIIPCHRVIGKNGRLTGYAAGIEKKIELLKIENILNSDSDIKV